MLRNIFKFLRWFATIVLLLCLTAYSALQHPVAQTWLSQQAAKWLSGQLGTTVRVGGVDIDLWARAVLESVYIEDLHSDTLAIIPALHIGSHSFDRTSHKLRIDHIGLDDPLIHLARYEDEQGMNFGFLVDYFSPADTLRTDSTGIAIDIGTIAIRNGSLRYNNFLKPSVAHAGIDWNHLALTGLFLEVSSFQAAGDSIRADIGQLACQEARGFALKSLSGALESVPGRLSFSGARIETPSSEILGDLSFGFETPEDWNDFTNKIIMKNDLQETRLCLADLAFFVPECKGLTQVVSLSGKISGSVSNIKGRKLELRWDKQSRFRGDIDMEGLPNIRQTFIELDVEELTSNKDEIDRIPIPPFDTLPARTLESPENFSRLGTMTFSGNFTGFINDFVAYGRLRTAIGDVRSDIALREDAESGEYFYTGNLEPIGFDFGTFYNKRDFGVISAALRVEGSGLEVETINANIEGVVSEFRFKGYLYRDATLKGNYRSKAFNGALALHDENASLDFNGNINFTGKEPFFSFSADIYNLNLKELNLYPDADYSGISGFVQMDSCLGMSLDSFRGIVRLSDVNYCSQGRDYFIPAARLSSVFEGPYRTIDIQSPFATGNINGIFDFNGIEKSFGDVVSKVITTYRPPAHTHRPQNFTLDLKEINIEEISRLFFPHVTVAPHSRVYIRLNEPANIFEINAHTDSLYVNDHRLYDLTIDVSRPDESLYMTVTSELARLGGMTLSSLAVDSYTEENHIQTNIVWGDTASWHGGEISGLFNIRGNENFDFEFGSSNLRLYDKNWTFREHALVQLDSTLLRITDFEVYHANQRLRADGVISALSRPRMNVEVNAFQLADLNFLTEKSNIKLEGELSGSASVRNFYGDPIFTSDLILNGFVLNDQEIGDLCLETEWDNQVQALDILGELARGKETPLTFDGQYTPQEKDSPLDVMVHARELDLNFINGFLAPGAMDLAGYVTGDIRLTGTPESPQLNGDLIPTDVSLYIHYLNTRYYVLKKVGVRPDMFTFDRIPCADQEGHLGWLTGQIIHDNFSKWSYEVSVDIEKEKFLCMDTKMTETSLYYGKAYGTGYVNIFGFGDRLEFEVNLRSAPGSTLGLPLGNTSEVVFEDFVRFVDPDKPEPEPEPLDLSGIRLNFQLEITPDVDFELVFDQAVGDVMKGRGQGFLSMDINTFGDFAMYGAIEILQGDYLFTLKNLVNKSFKNATGSIAWYGDPYDADINLTTTYSVSASLYELMPGEDQRYKQRIPVELGLKLTDNLMRPNIGFDIRLPTVDQITRSRVESVLANVEEKNRQAFALLVLQRFISPPNVTKERSGGIGLAENTSELVSSQLSNWLSQISSDFNLGFNYRPGDEISNDEIALALSTQLFDERLLLSTNVGVSRGNASNQNPSTLIGDIRVEYKITDEGKIRLMVYNESNDFNIASTQQSLYTQGVGVIYQEEFDTLDEFFCQFGNLLRRRNHKNMCP